MGQVILNLLNNAYDAIQKDTDKWITVETSNKAGLVFLSVTDSGAIIPDEVKAKMMQPFFTTKEIGKGTGLGLSISKGIVESHGGILAIDNSKVNTSFVIQLPLSS